MKLDRETHLDGRKHDGLARHFNRSFYPNFYAEKLTAQGYLRLGIFTKHSIKQGEELTLDYQWEMSY